MEKELNSVILYCCGIGLLPIFHLFIKRRIKSLSFFILLWIAILTSTSIAFYLFYYPILNSLSPEALLFSFVGMCILTTPLFIIDETKIKRIDFSGCLGFINKFCIVLGILSIPPLTENLLHFNTQSNMDFLVDTHALTDSGEVTNLSFLSSKMINFCSHFADILGLLLCTLLINKKRNKWAVIGIIICILSQPINVFLKGGRLSVVYQLYAFFIAYMLFYPVFNKKNVSKINKIGAVIVSICILLLIVSTQTRFGDKDVTYINAKENQAMLAALSTYTGEAPIRFSSFGWKLKGHSEGHSLYHYVVSFFNGTDFKLGTENREWIQKHTGLKYPQCFYGLPGYSYIDFGIGGGILNICIISFCILKICKRSGIIKFYDLIFMIVCFKILMMSTLFFPYCNSKIFDLGYLFALRLILKRLSERIHQRKTTSLYSRYNNPQI